MVIRIVRYIRSHERVPVAQCSCDERESVHCGIRHELHLGKHTQGLLRVIHPEKYLNDSAYFVIQQCKLPNVPVQYCTVYVKLDNTLENLPLG